MPSAAASRRRSFFGRLSRLRPVRALRWTRGRRLGGVSFRAERLAKVYEQASEMSR